MHESNNYFVVHFVLFSFTEFGTVWSIALLRRHEELNPQETTQEESSKDKNSLKADRLGI